MIMKQRIEELAAIMFGGKPARLLRRSGHVVPDDAAFVSIHIPAYREPPEMLRQTLDSVAKLDWPNFECVVVINNTPDTATVAADRGALPRCSGQRFKFVREDRLQGLQGRRSAARAGTYCARGRDHRRDRCRLCGAVRTG